MNIWEQKSVGDLQSGILLKLKTPKMFDKNRRFSFPSADRHRSPPQTGWRRTADKFSSFQVCLMRKRIGIGFPRSFETAPEILLFSYAIFRGRERPEVVLKTGCPDQVSSRFLLKSGNRFGKWGGEARLSDRLPILIQAYLAGWCLLPETGSRAKTSRKLSTEPVCFMHNIHCRTPAW